MKPYYETLREELRVMETEARAFPLHLHRQAEMLYLFDGEATMIVDDRRLHLKGGDLCLSFSGVIHGYGEPDGAHGLMLIFSPDLLQEFSHILREEMPADPLLPAADLPADVPLCLRQMRREIAEGADSSVLQGYLQVVLARVIPRLGPMRPMPESADFVHQALHYLTEHYTEPITLRCVARELCVGETYLSRLFSKRIHVGFCEYLNTLRADHARELLRSSDLPITQIAYECGFESQRTFNRVFQQRYGVTPSACRSQLRKAPLSSPPPLPDTGSIG